MPRNSTMDSMIITLEMVDKINRTNILDNTIKVSMVEQYQPNCNTFQSGIRASLVNYAILEEDSTESSERSLDRGFLEEFDDFCKEGKVKEVVKFLHLLQKQSVSVDLSYFLQLI
jgi:hypothetical protein